MIPLQEVIAMKTCMMKKRQIVPKMDMKFRMIILMFFKAKKKKEYTCQISENGNAINSHETVGEL